MLTYGSTDFMNRRADRMFSTIKCLQCKMISRLYGGNNCSGAAYPKSLGIKYNLPLLALWFTMVSCLNPDFRH